MRKNLILIGATLLMAYTFSACGDKEEASVAKNTVNVLIENDKNINTLSLYDNSFSIDAMIIPDGLDNVVDVKITSNADPEGFTKSVKLTDGSYVEGKIKYLYKRFLKSFSVALFTDADRGLIKVGNQGDIVTIDIGNGLYTEQLSFNSDLNVALTYWPKSEENNLSSTCFVYDYGFDGTQSPVIQVWTSYDDTKVNYDLSWNDPTQYNGLPEFNNYSIAINFIVGNASGNGKIGASEGCTVYIKYNNVTYTSVFGTTTHHNLPVAP
ncbi:MAG: hypothetical protein PHE33_08065 [Bacteroidales bacterium]|nr:hypothetical protein [Bacteroidales bacterium]